MTFLKITAVVIFLLICIGGMFFYLLAKHGDFIDEISSGEPPPGDSPGGIGIKRPSDEERS